LIAAVSYIFVAMAMAINSPLMDFIDERVLEYDWMFAIFVLAVFLLISYMVGSGASAPLASTEELAIYVVPRKVGEIGHWQDDMADMLWIPDRSSNRSNCNSFPRLNSVSPRAGRRVKDLNTANIDTHRVAGFHTGSGLILTPPGKRESVGGKVESL